MKILIRRFDNFTYQRSEFHRTMIKANENVKQYLPLSRSNNSYVFALRRSNRDNAKCGRDEETISSFQSPFYPLEKQ